MLISNLLTNNSLPLWFWFSLGLLLLIAEILGAGGFLLGTGVAALLIALLTLIAPLNWETQVATFAILSVLFTWYYVRHMRPNAKATDDPDLNNRMARLIGVQTELTKAIKHGRGQVQIQDAFWKVKSTDDLDVGSTVIVKQYEGSVLIVEAVDHQTSDTGSYE